MITVFSSSPIRDNTGHISFLRWGGGGFHVYVNGLSPKPDAVIDRRSKLPDNPDGVVAVDTCRFNLSCPSNETLADVNAFHVSLLPFV